MKKRNGRSESSIINVNQKCFNCPSIIRNNPNIKNPAKVNLTTFQNMEQFDDF